MLLKYVQTMEMCFEIYPWRPTVRNALSRRKERPLLRYRVLNSQYVIFHDYRPAGSVKYIYYNIHGFALLSAFRLGQNGGRSAISRTTRWPQRAKDSPEVIFQRTMPFRLPSRSFVWQECKKRIVNGAHGGDKV